MIPASETGAWFMLDKADDGAVLLLMPDGRMVIGRIAGDLFTRFVRGPLGPKREGRVPPCQPS